jgi:hypothetical protein
VKQRRKPGQVLVAEDAAGRDVVGHAAFEAPYRRQPAVVGSRKSI